MNRPAGWMFLGWALAAAPAAAEEPFLAARNVYLYDHAGQGQAGAAMVELETAVGTREARPFGEDGVMTGVRGRFGLHDRVTLEAFAGSVLDEAAAGSVDVYVGVLDDAAAGVDLTLGAGHFYDFQHVHTPRLHASLGKRFGAFHLALPVDLALPVTTAGDPARDAIDVSVGLVGSWGPSSAVRIGLEMLAEDLEGFWEAEEAEGGAKGVVGPTFWVAPGGGWRLKLNAAGVIPASRNTPGPGVPDASPGFLGRLNLGYVF